MRKTVANKISPKFQKIGTFEKEIFWRIIDKIEYTLCERALQKKNSSEKLLTLFVKEIRSWISPNFYKIF